MRTVPPLPPKKPIKHTGTVQKKHPTILNVVKLHI